MRDLAVVQLRDGQLQALGVHLRRGIFDEQLREAVASDAVSFRHHDAVAMGVNKVGIDPALARLADLLDVELAWREQNLSEFSIDRVTVDVGGVVDVRAQGLYLRDGVVERAPVPEPYVVKQSFV